MSIYGNPVTFGGGGATGIPLFSYTGQYELISDGGSDWRIKFLSSGILEFTSVGSGKDGIDVFCVGGGGGGSTGNNYHGGAGAGGGYTRTDWNIFFPQSGSTYTITVGAGGAAQTDGGTSSITDGVATVSAAGGKRGTGSGDGAKAGGAGGSGGGGSSRYGNGGNGGSNGSNGNGGSGSQAGGGGAGQITTTREFNDANGTLYAGGGAGGSGNGVSTHASGGAGGGGNAGSSRNGVANTGGGGAGTSGTIGGTGGAGGAGIVIIRNARVPV